ncbi:hypothetical protein [Clostridium botulinum]|uniref:hypothetical protein n=1 Tax=Clostridium botulinum TaxID=1491 RepID=UPI00311AB809
MDIFYRLQSNNYNITPSFKSFSCEFDSYEEALKEGEEYVEPGVSAFMNPKDLYNYYFEYFNECKEVWKNSKEYILVFKGIFVGLGGDNEDCAKFVEEIERISIRNFIKKIKNNL